MKKSRNKEQKTQARLFALSSEMQESVYKMASRVSDITGKPVSDIGLAAIVGSLIRETHMDCMRDCFGEKQDAILVQLAESTYPVMLAKVIESLERNLNAR